MRKAGKNPDLRIFSRTIMFPVLFLRKKSARRICNRIYAYVPHVVSLLYTDICRFSNVFLHRRTVVTAFFFVQLRRISAFMPIEYLRSQIFPCFLSIYEYNVNEFCKEVPLCLFPTTVFSSSSSTRAGTRPNSPVRSASAPTRSPSSRKMSSSRSRCSCASAGSSTARSAISCRSNRPTRRVKAASDA